MIVFPISKVGRLSILASAFILAILLTACSPAPNLSFTEKIIVERYDAGKLLNSVEIHDSNDVKSIISSCTETAKSGSGNCGFDIIKIIFMGGRKQMVLWPAGDGDPFIKLDGKNGRYYQISQEDRDYMFRTIEKYGIVLEYLSQSS